LEGALRVLTFTSLFPNSVDPSHAIFVYQRSSHLARRSGNEVIAVAPVPYFPSWIKKGRWRAESLIPDWEQVGEIEVYHPRYFLLPKISMPLHALLMFSGCARRVAALNKQKKIDCIDAHFVYPDGMAAVLLGKVLDVPVTVSARGTDLTLYPSYRLIRPMIRWTLEHADGVIAVSSSLKEAIVALGTKGDRVRVVPNGIDPSRFERVPRSEARAQLKLSVNESLLVSAGALVPVKDHVLLIRAFARIAEVHPKLQLFILGEGPLRGELERLVRELRLGDRVHLVGKRPNEELRLWFSAAETSCLTSTREGWPNVVTESLACGTPVVATRVGGIPEILDSPELGVLVEQTAEGVASGIEEVLSRKWNHEEISRRIRGRTWENVAAECEEVLVAAVRSHKSRPPH